MVTADVRSLKQNDNADCYTWAGRMTDFTFRKSGTCGCELLGPDGLVVAWTVDVGWAALIVGLLNGSGNLTQVSERPRPAAIILETYAAQEG